MSTLDELDYVVFYDKPFLKFERLLETYFAFAPRVSARFNMAIPLWLREKLFQKSCFAVSSNASLRISTWKLNCSSASTISATRRRHFFLRRLKKRRC